MKKIYLFIYAFSLILSLNSVHCQSKIDNDKELQKRILAIISRMDLKEKVAQLSGMGKTRNEFGDLNVPAFGTSGNQRVGIPDLIMGHGITGVRPGRDTTAHATYFCTSFAMACTWDTDLYGRVAAAMAKEMRAIGQNLNLGPTVNIIRHPLGGRNWETYSEDPYLTSRMVVPFVKAMQSYGVICGPKHFLANNQETNRFDINNVIDERTLNEIYLPAFKSAVQEGGALNIMASYNRVNGTFMCENKYYLTDVLRRKWGFKGFVLSDFGYGVRSTLGATNAGLNVEMHNTKFYGGSLIQAVKNGEISEKKIDSLLTDKLYAMMKIGMFDKDYPTFPSSIVHCDEHQKIALEVARKAPVLLKNEAQTLPLVASGLKSIAIIGPNAKNYLKGDLNYAHYLQGGGSGRVYYFKDAILTPYDEIKKMVGSKINVLYAQGCNSPNLTDTTGNGAMMKEALSVASKADKVILVLGFSGSNETEGFDRKTANLPAEQKNLIEQILKVNPKVVLNIIAGCYVEMEDWYKQVPAILFCPYAGEKTAQGLADILFGKYSPQGKLPITYPYHANDYPQDALYTGKGFSECGNSNIYSEGIFVGYRYFDKQNMKVQYPFGYGLSYTSFEYSNLQVSNGIKNDSIHVSFSVKNNGKYLGSEIAQLYVSELNPTVDRAPKELKNFTSITLKPGQVQYVSMSILKESLGYYDILTHNWKTNAGNYKLLLGSSSRDVRLSSDLLVR